MADSTKTTHPLFQVCKSISAKDVAEKVGLPLIQRGSRFWTHCPLHEDKTPSMLFNEDGTFKCFSCSLFGDSVRLYELIHRIEPLEAAKRLIADFGITGPASGTSTPITMQKAATVRELKKAVEDVSWNRINQLLEIKYAANERMREIEGNKSDISEFTETDFDKLDVEIAKSSAATALIDTIEAMTFQQKIDWIADGAKFDEL